MVDSRASFAISFVQAFVLENEKNTVQMVLVHCSFEVRFLVLNQFFQIPSQLVNERQDVKLDAGQEVAIAVRFTPSRVAAFKDTLVIQHPRVEGMSKYKVRALRRKKTFFKLKHAKSNTKPQSTALTLYRSQFRVCRAR